MGKEEDETKVHHKAVTLTIKVQFQDEFIQQMKRYSKGRSIRNG